MCFTNFFMKQLKLAERVWRAAKLAWRPLGRGTARKLVGCGIEALETSGVESKGW